MVDVAEDAYLAIWLGLAGLIATGCLHADHLQGALKRVVDGPGKGLLIRVALTGAISQAAWGGPPAPSATATAADHQSQSWHLPISVTGGRADCSAGVALALICG